MNHIEAAFVVFTIIILGLVYRMVSCASSIEDNRKILQDKYCTEASHNSTTIYKDCMKDPLAFNYGRIILDKE